MIKNFKIFERESEHSDIEKEHLLRQLNSLFTELRERYTFLKNIWFKLEWNNTLKYNVHDKNRYQFIIKIIWFFSHKTTNLILPPYEYARPIYQITEKEYTFKVENNITQEISQGDISLLLERISEICIIDIPKYLDYKSYPNILKMEKNVFLILDYDKFIKEFEEELDESKSPQLYKLIDNFDGLLLYADNKKRQKIQLYLKQKYQYIDAIQNYNL